MWNDSGKPVYVNHRAFGSLTRGVILLLISAFCFFIVWIILDNPDGLDFSSTIGPVALLGAMGAICVVAAVYAFSWFHHSKKVEFYEDHLRLFGYNRDGQETKDFDYSALSVGDFQMRGGGRSPSIPTFEVSLRTEPPIHWRVTSGSVRETNARMPLYAWLREKTGVLTEDQRQQELRVVSKRLTSFNRRIRPTAFVVMGIGAVLLLGGAYEIQRAFVLASGSSLAHGPLTIGSYLASAGLFVLAFGLALLISQRSMLRTIARQRTEDLPDRLEAREAESLREKYRKEHPELDPGSSEGERARPDDE